MMPRANTVLRLIAPGMDAHGRRIVVAGVAGVLLTAPETFDLTTMPRLQVGWALTGLGAVLAIRAAQQSWNPSRFAAAFATLVCLAFCCVTAAASIPQLSSALAHSDKQLACTDDVSTNSVVGGQEVMQGQNPYTNSDILKAERQLGCSDFRVTPLRAGPFRSYTTPPKYAQIQAVSSATLAGHSAGGIVLRYDYPAGTALLGLAGARGLVVLSPIALLLAGFFVVRRSPSTIRRALVLALGAQTALLLLVGAVRPDGVVTALLIVACTQRRTLMGGVALGLACATKQTAWFVAPALLLLAWREGKRRDKRYVLGTFAAFAVVNLPFVIANPGAWVSGVLTPLTSPFFPAGFGPAGFFGAGNFSDLALSVMTTLMIVTVLTGTIMCAIAPLRWASTGVIIASLGLWAGTRSYGYYIVLMGLIAVCTIAGREFDRAPEESGRYSVASTMRTAAWWLQVQ